MFKHYILYNSLVLLTIQTMPIFSNHNQSSISTKYTIIQADYNSPITEIATVVNLAYNKTLWLKSGVQRTSVPELRAIVAQPTKRLYLCLDNQAKLTICGAVLLDLSSSDPEMSMLAVHPKYQKQNIGNLLMQHVEQELLKLGQDHLLIYVVPFGQDKLVAYYQHHGYQFLETILPFTHLQLVRSEYQDKIFLRVMRKEMLL